MHVSDASNTGAKKMLTRNGVALLLGRKGSLNARRMAVRALEHRELHPVREGHEWLFDEAEVIDYMNRNANKLPPRRRIIDADLEAAIIVAVDKGESVVTIAQREHVFVRDVVRIRDQIAQIRADETRQK